MSPTYPSTTAWNSKSLNQKLKKVPVKISASQRSALDEQRGLGKAQGVGARRCGRWPASGCARSSLKLNQVSGKTKDRSLSLCLFADTLCRPLASVMAGSLRRLARVTRATSVWSSCSCLLLPRVRMRTTTLCRLALTVVRMVARNSS